MDDRLCWECLQQRWNMGQTTYVGDHCHHEPKEKPKPKCPVCGHGSFRMTVDNQSQKMGHTIHSYIKFCPECGKDLR